MLLGPATIEFLLTTYTTSPPMPWAAKRSAAALETRKDPLAMTSCCRSQSSSEVSDREPAIERPALFTTMSMPPNNRAAGEKAPLMLEDSVTLRHKATP